MDLAECGVDSEQSIYKTSTNKGRIERHWLTGKRRLTTSCAASFRFPALQWQPFFQRNVVNRRLFSQIRCRDDNIGTATIQQPWYSSRKARRHHRRRLDLVRRIEQQIEVAAFRIINVELSAEAGQLQRTNLRNLGYQSPLRNQLLSPVSRRSTSHRPWQSENRRSTANQSPYILHP